MAAATDIAAASASPDARLSESGLVASGIFPITLSITRSADALHGNRRLPLIVSWANGYLSDCLTVSEAHTMPDGAGTSQAVMAVLRLFRGLECVDTGLTPSQYRIMVDGAGGERFTRLAQRLAVAKPAGRAALDRADAASITDSTGDGKEQAHGHRTAHDHEHAAQREGGG